MKTFCCRCDKEAESTLLAEIRECECGTRWECRDNPETKALKTRLSDTEKRLEDALGEVNHLRDYRNDPESNMSFGMLRIMHNVDLETIIALRAQAAELEAENKRLKEIAAFSRHSHDCEEFDGWDCTCGYAKALKGGE